MNRTELAAELREAAGWIKDAEDGNGLLNVADYIPSAVPALEQAAALLSDEQESRVGGLPKWMTRAEIAQDLRRRANELWDLGDDPDMRLATLHFTGDLKLMIGAADLLSDDKVEKDARRYQALRLLYKAVTWDLCDRRVCLEFSVDDMMPDDKWPAGGLDAALDAWIEREGND